jgi:nucleotide-binding universal stress UspA family protein
MPKSGPPEMSTEHFNYDVFLSHSSKDKAVVRELAARLKKDGIRVWLDEEQIKAGDPDDARGRTRTRLSRVPAGERQ